MYNILVHSHSGVRWIFVILLISSLLLAITAYFNHKTFGKRLDITSRVTVITAHIQLLLGLILYFISPKVVFDSIAFQSNLMRFYLVEHITLMLLGIALLTIGSAKIKRAAADIQKLRYLLIFFGIGFIIILAGVPWPFYNLGTKWF